VVEPVEQVAPRREAKVDRRQARRFRGLLFARRVRDVPRRDAGEFRAQIVERVV
jgi:hypothetical protein